MTGIKEHFESKNVLFKNNGSIYCIEFKIFQEVKCSN